MMRNQGPRSIVRRLLVPTLLACAVAGFAPTSALGSALAQQDAPPPPASDPATDAAVGQPVAEVRVVGNRQVSDIEILNSIRTEVGEPFDPQTVTGDYQRIYSLRRFSNVDARYELSPDGVIVVFTVVEQAPVEQVVFRGNTVFDERRLRQVVAAESGLAADPVLLGFARDGIERLYRSKNYPLVQIRVDRNDDGSLVYDITEGPRVLVRNIDFLGAPSFSERELKRNIATRTYFPGGFFGYNGRYDEETLDQDVGAIKQFYRNRGFFDVRVGRRSVWSDDLGEVQIEFLVDEGEQYTIGDIDIVGNEALDDDTILKAMAENGLSAGEAYDADKIRDLRQELVRLYSPFGFIYQTPQPGLPQDPTSLSFNIEPRVRLEPGTVDLRFVVSEGRPFRVGRIRLRGNQYTKDKVLLRQFDLAPGELYDSDAVRRGQQRLLQSQYFSQLRVTPVLPENADRAEMFDAEADAYDTRDLLIEVEEMSTASLLFSGAVSSNGGVFGSITYEQKNFDIADWPTGVGEVFRGEAFRGAGQLFRAKFEPGTIRTNASITFFEPYLFDRNLGFGTDVYYRTTRRRQYNDRRAGGQVRFVPRIGRKLSTTLSLRGEDVYIYDIDDPIADRAPEIVAGEGHEWLTSVGVRLGYRDVDDLLLPSLGYDVQAGWEGFGLLGGDPRFDRFTASAVGYVPLYRDLLDRPTVFETRLDAGVADNAPFYEAFYAGGFGSLRGFRFRGVSPRDGIANDPVGGDYIFTSSAGIGFPLYGDTLRGVVFTDAGSVSDDTDFGTIRVSAGAGIRLQFDAIGNVPIAIDLAWPVNKRSEDNEQVLSFSLGILR